MSERAPQIRGEPDLPGRLVARTTLVWAGLCLGVAALGAPVAMLRLYNGMQLGGLLVLALLAVCSPRRRRWLMRLSAPATAVVAQAVWLAPPPPAAPALSPYLALEAFKAIWLLVAGFGADPLAGRVLPAHAHRSSWAPVPPVRPIADRAWPPFPGA